MTESSSRAKGPDLTQGLSLEELPDGALRLGHVGDEGVLLARKGEEVFAVGAKCTHYGGPLAEGLLVGDTVRCPWHHACFSLRTGAPLRAPALNPIDCWHVERRGGMVYVSNKLPAPAPTRALPGNGAGSIVIIGGGGAGHCAAEALRNEGYSDSITIISADAAAPCDRPNLSKDYLAGNAPEEWIPLRPADFYRDHAIDLRLSARAAAIHAARREVELEGGGTIRYDKLLIATGAEPVRLQVPGTELPHVHYLRTLNDSRAIVEASGRTRRAVVIGASFIGLEVAASLRARNLEVHVVAPDVLPLQRVLGPELGRLIRGIHEEHGVRFHLGRTARSLDSRAVTLDNGEQIAADLVVIGIGVRPNTALAEASGIRIDGGIAVDAYLESSIPGIFAAGDAARWPDPHSGEGIRVEHWVVAERQGQLAARNLLGKRERFDAVPYFWSMHYDVQIQYVGHAAKWDQIEIEGDVQAKECKVSYRLGGRVAAVATIGRDLDSLRSEVALEHQSG